MPGGLLNQPAGLVDKMQVLFNVWKAIKTRNRYGMEAAKFIKDCPEDFAICNTVDKLRNGKQ